MLQCHLRRHDKVNRVDAAGTFGETRRETLPGGLPTLLFCFNASRKRYAYSS
jgi:hypothetical protein